MQTISNTEFRSLLASNNIPIEGLKIVGDVQASQIRSYQTIDNCEFETLNINSSAGPITIKKCIAVNLNITARYNVVVNLIDCEIKGIVNIIGASSDGDKSNVEVYINGSETNIEFASIQGYLKSIDIEQTNQIKNIELNKCVLEVFRAQKIESTYFVFNNAIISKSASFLSNTKTFLNISDSNINEIFITLATRVNINLESVKSNSVVIFDGSYDSIEFVGTGEFDLIIGSKQLNTHINRLLITEFYLKDKSRLKILDSTMSLIKIDNFENNGIFTLSNCEITDSLNFKDSNLGKSVFNNINTQNAKIRIKNSNLLDIIFTNFRWPEKYKFDYNVKNEKFLTLMRESYRQLKVNYQKSGNKIESLEFQKNELATHYEILKTTTFKRYFWLLLFTFHKSSWSSLGNFLIVGTNKWSSDFGQNIWRPLFLLFFFHLVLFNLVLSFNPEIGISFNYFSDIDKKTTLQAIKLFFQTILPIHNVELKIDQEHIVSIGGFLDFMMRISSGYFIYYFVSASRKYHQ